MTAAALSGWRPMLTAFVIWFAHFMLCWAAVEIWPRQWPANMLAWTLTPLALVALGLQWVRLRAGRPGGELTGWIRRFGQAATALASVAVVFSAVPSIVFLP
jgi:hypothetical protein